MPSRDASCGSFLCIFSLDMNRCICHRYAVQCLDLVLQYNTYTLNQTIATTTTNDVPCEPYQTLAHQALHSFRSQGRDDLEIQTRTN